MKKTQKILALSLGSLLAVSVFAACNGTKPEGGTAPEAGYYGRICYDNLNADYVSAADSQIAVSGKVSDLVGIDADGKEVSA